MESEPRRESSFISINSVGFHRLAYSDWGPVDGPIIICAHVMTGNGHDYDYLAHTLAMEGYRVIAVDMPGRGRSDFLPNPADYAMPQYLKDIAGLFAHLDIQKEKSIDWIGSSMGGLMGMILAAMPGSPIKRMVINDVGPVIPQAALDHINTYVGKDYSFRNLQELEDKLRELRGPTWGPINDEQWDHMANNNARAREDGNLTLAYDPAIAVNSKGRSADEVNLWPFWDAIEIPVLLLRGADSTLFLHETAQEMCARGPGAKNLVTFEELAACGHAPSLMAWDHIGLIQNWLEEQ